MEPTEHHSPKIQVFIAYSRKDTDMLGELVSHLSVLERNKTVDRIWYDGKIEAGSDWDEEIKTNLKESDIILLLISADFIASEYCYGKEMKDALVLHKKGKAKVIPILIRSCVWEETPFAELQALPQDGKPISSVSNKDESFADITIGIKELSVVVKEEKVKILEAQKRREAEATQRNKAARLVQFRESLFQALEFLRAREWHMALMYFEDCQNVDVSHDQHAQIQNGINTCKVELEYLEVSKKATSSYEEGDYLGALVLFEKAHSLKNNDDTLDLINECRKLGLFQKALAEQGGEIALLKKQVASIIKSLTAATNKIGSQEKELAAVINDISGLLGQLNPPDQAKVDKPVPVEKKNHFNINIDNVMNEARRVITEEEKKKQIPPRGYSE